MAQDLTDKELFSHPLVQSLLDEVDKPRIRLPAQFYVPIAKQFEDEDRFIVAGYASVEIIDSQNELIPVKALKDAWEGFIKNEEFAHCNIMHSNIPVGKVLKSYADKKGNIWKSGVDDKGLFIVSEVRNDIRKGEQTKELITNGRLTGYSIGGEALASSTVCEDKCYTRIDKLELHEISYVDRPANEASIFTVVKAEQLKKLSVLLDALPNLIISPGVAKIMGSTVELGEGQDYDVLITAKKGSFVDRAIQTRIHNELRKAGKLDLWDSMQIVHEPEGLGPYTDYHDLYDLVLLRSLDAKIKIMTPLKSEDSWRKTFEEGMSSSVKKFKKGVENYSVNGELDKSSWKLCKALKSYGCKALTEGGSTTGLGTARSKEDQ